MWAGSPNDPFSDHIIQWLTVCLSDGLNLMIKLATLANYFPPYLLVMAHRSRIVHVVPFSPLYTHEDMLIAALKFFYTSGPSLDDSTEPTTQPCLFIGFQ